MASLVKNYEKTSSVGICDVEILMRNKFTWFIFKTLN
jgi:hypothetical protein